MVYMMKYDSAQRKGPKGDVFAKDLASLLLANGKEITVYVACMDPASIQWKDAGLNILSKQPERSLRTKAKAHFEGGAKKLFQLLQQTPMFVMGVNNDKYTKDMNIVSNAVHYKLPCAFN